MIGLDDRSEQPGIFPPPEIERERALGLEFQTLSFVNAELKETRRLKARAEEAIENYEREIERLTVEQSKLFQQIKKVFEES